MIVHAVIPAAGQGKRLGGETKKQFLELCGLPILIHTLIPFQSASIINEITCVVSKEDCSFIEGLVSSHRLDKVKRILHGGERRQDSVWAAVSELCERSDPNDLILVHDGVRPLVTTELIERVAAAAAEVGGAVAARPVTDSLKRVSSGRIISQSLPRENVWAMQTPQAFRLSLLREAYQKAETDRFEATDEAMLVERLGHPIRCVEGSAENIKITTPPDLRLAEILLHARGEERRR
ncbi:MAG: 2-C-methyl-D-erythritol 4-phosphate cytidylyltransferase [Nitrospirae bacterium]|nr:2-C-methyl-D-erythritol 4-phosphate cytidylyltransferase [Candidatus Manganitrophaceae bacterium]